MTKTDSIVIVGGGSSGWITASTLIHSFPNKKITLIESPNHPIIGVGESTQATITLWAQSLGIDHEDFMKYQHAGISPQLGKYRHHAQSAYLLYNHKNRCSVVLTGKDFDVAQFTRNSS